MDIATRAQTADAESRMPPSSTVAHPTPIVKRRHPMTTTTEAGPAVLGRRRPTLVEQPAPAVPDGLGCDSPPCAPLRAGLDLLSLPPELHLAVSGYLIYPDALSLKHTNRHFYSIVDTGIELKIDWLMERRRLHLECPNDRRCDLGSDLRFCRGSVPAECSLLMRRRREHIECESRPGLGCLVYGTPACAHRPQRPQSRWRAGLQAKFTVELWWLLVLALVPVLIACGLAARRSEQ
ncbi:F-box domain-containing protein [Purpureocillium lavendulum]|uniref:F-box domain-containing protein n=1 Tax=Purpureocillium lavendulum TaxID=1247861 RepID=A0AB34G8F3_9HYPO|nr:F-box domain-containing protein [Purpureocillium lavendulum]